MTNQYGLPFRSGAPPAKQGVPPATRLPPPRITDASTLAEARAYVLEERDGGVQCPCCDQRAQVYRRQIHSRMARDLILCLNAALASGSPATAVHLPELVHNRGDASKLTYWGLLQEERIQREDGGRAGWWHVTPAGVLFARGMLEVPKYALVYNGRCLGMEGPPVTILDCIGIGFNLAELLAGGEEERRCS